MGYGPGALVVANKRVTRSKPNLKLQAAIAMGMAKGKGKDKMLMET